MSLKIIFDKSVPIPQKDQTPSELFTTLDQMEVGDSFEYHRTKIASMTLAVSRHHSKGTKEFITRKTSMDLRRVWRVV